MDVAVWFAAWSGFWIIVLWVASKDDVSKDHDDEDQT